MRKLKLDEIKLPDEIVDLPRSQASSVNGGWGFFKKAWKAVKRGIGNVVGRVVELITGRKSRAAWAARRAFY